jgi:hypothetical protein
VLDEADGLLKQGYEGFINRVHAQIPKVTSDGKRLQVCVSALTFLDLDLLENCIYFLIIGNAEFQSLWKACDCKQYR